MRVTYRNKEVPISSATLKQDLRDYYSKLIIQTPLQLPNLEVVKVDFNSEQENFIVKKQELGEAGFIVTLISESQSATMSALYEPFCGVADVHELAEELGLKVARKFKTNKTWWNIPKSSCITILDTLTKYASVSNGGAPVFFINIKGELDLVDYVEATTKEPRLVQATVKSNVIDTEWMCTYPSTLTIYGHSSSEGEFVEEVELHKGQNHARRFISDNTGKFKDLAKQSFTNKYNKLLYTSEVVEFTCIVPVTLGDHVALSEALELNYVVESITIPFVLEQQKQVEFIVRATCRPLELE